MYLTFLAFILAIQQPSPELDAVIKRATSYVEKYEAELGNLIGTEDYLQTWTSGRPPRKATRRTASDALIIQVGKEWAALRKVNTVNGFKVKAVPAAFTDAFSAEASDNSKRLIQMKTESAAQNLGDVVRDINAPTFALRLLRESEVWRFTFERAGTEKVDGVSVWVMRFTERGLQTLVRGDRGELLHSTGTLWIEPETGRVLRTEFLVENAYAKKPVKARTAVSYGKAKGLDLLVPRQMTERYESTDSIIECIASYSNFRRFEVNVKFDFGVTKPR